MKQKYIVGGWRSLPPASSTCSAVSPLVPPGTFFPLSPSRSGCGCHFPAPHAWIRCTSFQPSQPASLTPIAALTAPLLYPRSQLCLTDRLIPSPLPVFVVSHWPVWSHGGHSAHWLSPLGSQSVGVISAHFSSKCFKWPGVLYKGLIFDGNWIHTPKCTHPVIQEGSTPWTEPITPNSSLKQIHN